MEAIAAFLLEEKQKTEHRIRRCESFLNAPEVLSAGILEGLQSLLQNAEDDYGSLLHLEKLVRMNRSGDLDAGTAIFASAKRPSAGQAAFGQSLPVHYGLSSYTASAERKATPRKTISFERHSPDGFCGFQFDEDEDSGDDAVQKALASRRKPEKARPAGDRGRKKLSVREEADEEEGDLFDEDPSAYPSDHIRVPRAAGGDNFGLARSLPLSVPLSVPLHKHKLLQKNDDQDDFEDISEIPTKIAELARSVHGGDIFGDLPSPRREQRVG